MNNKNILRSLQIRYFTVFLETLTGSCIFFIMLISLKIKIIL